MPDILEQLGPKVGLSAGSTCVWRGDLTEWTPDCSSIEGRDNRAFGRARAVGGGVGTCQEETQKLPGSKSDGAALPAIHS